MNANTTVLNAKPFICIATLAVCAAGARSVSSSILSFFP
jgi:hypothetical protein